MKAANVNSPVQNIMQRQTSRQAEHTYLQRLDHELVNQLTIVNFCCDKMRRHFAAKLETTIAVEIERIEKTIEECVRLLQQSEQQNPSGATDRMFG
jgi:hypothetical protein